MMVQQFKQTPRYRLTELASRLPKGAQAKIASRLGCSPKTVSNVLNGKQTQSSNLARNIIRLAEQMTR